MDRKWGRYGIGLGLLAVLVGRIWHLRWQQSILWDQLLLQYDSEGRALTRKARLNSSSVVRFLQDGGINVSQAQFAQWFDNVDDEQDGFDLEELFTVAEAVHDFGGMRGNLKTLEDQWVVSFSTHMDMLLTVGAACIVFWLVHKLDDLQSAISSMSIVHGIKAANLQSRWQDSHEKAELFKAQETSMWKRIKQLENERDQAVQQAAELQIDSQKIGEVRKQAEDAEAKKRDLEAQVQKLKETLEPAQEAYSQAQAELQETRARMKSHVDQAGISVKKQLLAMQRCIRGVDAFRGIGKNMFQDNGAATGFAVTSKHGLMSQKSRSRSRSMSFGGLERSGTSSLLESSPNGQSLGFHVESNMIFGHLTQAGVQFFEVDRRRHCLGEGADGAYRCKDIATEEEYALKIYDIEKFGLDDQHSRAVLADLNVKRCLDDHDNIVRYIHVIEAEKQLFVLMELIEGMDLWTFVRSPGDQKEQTPKGRSQRCMERTAACIFAQVCEGLKYVHSQNVIHGDVKPENIMVVQPDEVEPHVKLIDFGLSSFINLEGKDAQHCQDAYAPPEARSDPPGPVVKESDIYRLGGTLYYMLTGNTFSRYAFTRGLSLDSVSTEIRDLMRSLLKDKPEDRIPLDDVLRHPWVWPHVSWELQNELGGSSMPAD